MAQIHTVDSWVALTRGKERAQKYDDAVHTMTSRDEYMAQYFGGPSNGVVTARLWFVDDRYNDSNADSYDYLVNYNGRLFGVVAPEALGAEKAVVGATLDDVLAFGNKVPDMTPKQLEAYEEAVRVHYAKR